MSRRARLPLPDPGQLLTRAVQAHQAGQLDSAEALYQDVLRALPEQTDALHLLGVLALQRGRPAEAVKQIRRAVARRPDSAVYLGNLGVALQASGQLGEARAALERAVTLEPRHVDALFNLGVTFQTSGETMAAVERYRQVLTLAPGHAGAAYNLGNALHALGRHAEAVEAYQRALATAPGQPDVLGSFGAALAALGRLDEAIEAFVAATTHAPADPGGWLNLGVALHEAGRFPEAIAAYRRATALRPDHAESWRSLGRALVANERADEAIDCYRQAVRVHAAASGQPVAAPDGGKHLAEAELADAALDAAPLGLLCDLGGALKVAERYDEAVRVLRRAVLRGPDDLMAWTTYGATLAAIGDLDEAAVAYGRVVDLDPADADALSKRIFLVDLLPTTTLAEAYAVRRLWNERHALPLAPTIRSHPNALDPERRLRVGYVSADFCRHSAATTFLTILEAHDPAAVEIVCYAGNRVEDDLTERFRAVAARWRQVNDLSDEALAAQIRADEIDVLVDLSGHSGGNRLLAVARKPAPVQVTAWGYATGTGLDAIDAFFADPVVVPPEDRRWYAEEVVDLPNVTCFAPPLETPPVVPPPVLERGTVTFGSYNRPIKITPAVLETWARVLLAVPGSRLLLKPGRQDSPVTRARLLGGLERHGVDPARVEMLGLSVREEHLATFGLVDIQLDPFPHTGGITTLEGLLMGVPCVTLLGERVPGRLSASFLTALGLDDLIARTADEYVAIAARLAGDSERLARERETLRARLLASPIADADQYARAAEAAYRALWRRWCARPALTLGVGGPSLTPEPGGAGGPNAPGAEIVSGRLA